MGVKGKLFPAAGVLAALLALRLWGPGKPDFPNREAVSAMGQEAAEAALLGRERREVLRAWGEPDGTLSSLFGDIYRLENGGHVIIYYDTEPMNSGTAGLSTIPVEYIRLMEE